MKRTGLIFIAGLVVALVAYFGFYYLSTARYRSLEQGQRPELAWLKDEFHLGDAEFKRICRMHEAYLAGCAERCRRIDQTNAELKRLLAGTNTVTPEIASVLREAAQLRAECQEKMLQHFYEVSRTMPPAQGKRYLEWVQEQTILSDSHRGMQPHGSDAPMPMEMK